MIFCRNFLFVSRSIPAKNDPQCFCEKSHAWHACWCHASCLYKVFPGMSCNLITQCFCRKCHATWINKSFAGNVMQPDYTWLLQEMSCNPITQRFCRKNHANWLQKAFAHVMSCNYIPERICRKCESYLEKESCCMRHLIGESFCGKFHAIWLQGASVWNVLWLDYSLKTSTGNHMESDYRELLVLDSQTIILAEEEDNQCKLKEAMHTE